MTASIWRLSHLTLALTSVLFIVIASVTGIILAFEPINNKLKPFDVVDLNQVSIAETVAVLSEKYEEVINLKVDENNFVSAAVITKDGNSDTFYINPKTGTKVGSIIGKAPIYEFATSLHRSLFLKSTGRFLIGFASLLLLLIAISGIVLIVKRQGGFLKFFSKIIKEDFNQYYHIIFGRYFLIPIIIITLTGVYLSLEKFSLLPKDKNKHQNYSIESIKNKLGKPTDFQFFKATTLAEVKNIEFPFSTDKEDYFYIKTIDKEYAIQQFNGKIVSTKKQSLTSLGSYYSLIFHTGTGSILWSLVLVLSCFAILFFIFSGFSITLKRRKNNTKIKNKYHKDSAEYIILFGTETGSTLRYAIAFYNALIRAKKTVFIGDLNSYDTYLNAKNIIVFAATYGDGEAPSNATKFLNKFKNISQQNMIKFSVVGFGSTDYKAFCQYSILVHSSMQIHDNFVPILPIYKIDNQSFTAFKNWLKEWNSFNKLNVQISKEIIDQSKPKLEAFKVIQKSTLNVDDTFLIELKPSKKTIFTSGDLLSITPKHETKNRLYSIAKVNGNILLSIKKHKFGICSTYLHELETNDSILAAIYSNKNFHLAKNSKDVILIANGTGIAPFLGMISKNKQKNIHLFWGGRTKESFTIYRKHIDTSIQNKSLNSCYTAYSQEQDHKIYVQDVLKNHPALIENTLKDGGEILICGSLSMQKGVTEVIDLITKQKLKSSFQSFQDNHQIKTDCY